MALCCPFFFYFDEKINRNLHRRLFSGGEDGFCFTSNRIH